ncbi:hypothetical protein GQ54DRAFT_297509 [Martensiomyces pterosporus]|nr:hypothetical protein GQ54DRAFT_297509 [Martensiomyces pterosporus]
MAQPVPLPPSSFLLLALIQELDRSAANPKAMPVLRLPHTTFRVLVASACSVRMACWSDRQRRQTRLHGRQRDERCSQHLCTGVWIRIR